MLSFAWIALQYYLVACYSTYWPLAVLHDVLIERNCKLHLLSVRDWNSSLYGWAVAFVSTPTLMCNVACEMHEMMKDSYFHTRLKAEGYVKSSKKDKEKEGVVE